MKPSELLEQLTLLDENERIEAKSASEVGNLYWRLCARFQMSLALMEDGFC